MLKDLCFEIIQTCPNKCMFCSSNSSQEKTTIIELEYFKKTITHFLNNGGIEEISISGGEPFLHPDLFEMIKFCKTNKIRTVIFTSGIKHSSKMSNEFIQFIKDKCKNDLEEIEKNEPWNERLKSNIKAYYDRQLKPNTYTCLTKKDCENLKQLGLDKIVFDFQTANSAIDNELMGRKNLNHYLFTSLIRAAMSGLNVDVHFIPMKPNYKEISDILESLEMVNVKNISILNFVPQGRGKENKTQLMLTENELKEFFEILKTEMKLFNGNIRIGIPLNDKISHLCTAGTEKLDIKYDGTILPCPAFKEISEITLQKHGIKLHNIYEDLEKVTLHSGKRDMPLCQKIYNFNSNLMLNN